MIRSLIRRLLPGSWQPYALNMGWLLFGRSVRLALGFAVGVWVARYLGPSNFGLLNFVTSVVALVIPVSQLGLEQILTRERVRNPKARAAHLGSALGLRVLGLFVAYAILALYVVYGNGNSDITPLIGIASLSLPLQLFSVVDAEYQARVASRYSVWVRTGALFIASGLRIMAIVCEAPLTIFIWLMVIENFFMGLGWWIAAEKHRFSPRNWYFDLHTALHLWQESWPVLIASAAMAITVHIDQVMIQHILGEQSLGQYAAAVRISTLLYFLPMAAMSTFFPALLHSREKNKPQYFERLEIFFSGMIWMGIGLASVFAIFGEQMVGVLYGARFELTGEILRIHVWSLVFVCMSFAGSRWFLAENRQHLLIVIHSIAAVVNVILNFWWLPEMGIKGAAFATLFSYFVTGYAGNFIFSFSRENGQRLTRALNPKVLFLFMRQRQKGNWH